jgi:hypothetical protein
LFLSLFPSLSPRLSISCARAISLTRCTRGCRRGTSQEAKSASTPLPPARRTNPFHQVEIGISLPKNQLQHRTLHIQKNLLRYALC